MDAAQRDALLQQYRTALQSTEELLAAYSDRNAAPPDLLDDLADIRAQIAALEAEHSSSPNAITTPSASSGVSFVESAVHGDATVNVGRDLAGRDIINNYYASPQPTSLAPARPAPFLVEPLPADFVPRPGAFEPLRALLLAEGRTQPVAITAALRGAGGYGKTTLARALCHDPEVRRVFRDGIFWVTLGEQPNLLGALLKLYAALTDARPAFVDLEDAAQALAGQWGEHACLLVIDDVWNETHLRPFLRGGPACARLVTTRDRAILPPEASGIDVDAMQLSEAAALLAAGLPAGDAATLDALARRLGEWPLLLKLVNGALREQVDLGLGLDAALAYIGAALDEEGLTTFDARNTTERDRAVRLTLNVSMAALNPAERARYDELAVFPEDTPIPLATLERLWGATGRLTPFQVRKLCTLLYRTSLLLAYDGAAQTIRLHDIVRAYLLHEQRDEMPALHAKLLDAYRSTTNDQRPTMDGRLPTTDYRLPTTEPYLWTHLAYHLRAADRLDELRALLLDFGWLTAKLHATDINALLADYDHAPGNDATRTVQGTLRLAAHILSQDKTHLPAQLLGRLLANSEPLIAALLERARAWRGAPWLRPLTASLTPPGGPLVRTLGGHNGEVTTVALSADGQFALAGVRDGTLKVWDVASGVELRTLPSYGSYYPIAAALSADGQLALCSIGAIATLWDTTTGEKLGVFGAYPTEKEPEGRAIGRIIAVALSANCLFAFSEKFEDKLKLALWDITTGSKLHMLTRHIKPVTAVALSADGQFVLTAVIDHPLKLWDIASGTKLRTLKGHTDMVTAVALSADGRLALSGSLDKTLRLWDTTTGISVGTIIGHFGRVTAVALSADGRLALSGSNDGTLKLWDVAGLHGTTTNRRQYTPVALSADGRLAFSGSGSGLKLWDAATGNELCTLASTTWKMCVALSADRRFALSGGYSGELKLWDVATGSELRTLAGHTGEVYAVALSADGQLALSGAKDQTLKLWDVATGSELRTLTGHTAPVWSLALSADGQFALSGASDGIMKLWNVATGAELRTLKVQNHAVDAVALNTDGRRALSGGGYGTLKLWDLTTGSELNLLAGHVGRVSAVALSADGQMALSNAENGLLCLWNLITGTAIAMFSTENSLSTCALSADGTTMVAGEASGRVHFLRLEGWPPEHGT